MNNHYAQAVVAAGGAPLIVPFTSDVSVYESLLPRIDGFVLSGGQDISPVRYGGDITYGKLSELTPEREEVEYLLLSYTYQFDYPLLGICRGMQVMNIVKGGGIYQDIGVQAGTTLKHIQQAPRSYGTHSIFVEDNTLLTDLWENKRTVVNSLHHQSCSTLGEGFIVSARSADGLIEAIEHKDNRFAVGVQWHPEAMKTEEMGLLFSAFLKAAAEYQQARR